MIMLSSSIRQTIFDHAKTGYPDEVCGVLLGKSEGNDFAACRSIVIAMPARNIEVARRKDRYQLNPADMAEASRVARQQGLDILGFYHSHPDHPAIASQTDLENSSPWGGYSYPIVSVIKGEIADLRSWYRENDAWIEEEILEGEK